MTIFEQTHDDVTDEEAHVARALGTNAIAIPGYQIISKLGQGGTATVYLAIQNSFERRVALKIMSPLLSADPSFAARFLREARIVSQMHHASIVPVFDVGEYQRLHYMSMEWLPGGDLRQRILAGQCGPRLALEVCYAVCAALELAHSRGFVHRDIKPHNILFRQDGTPVLTDFGIARAMEAGTTLTTTGMFVGTPSYMSPEQIEGLELDARSDLYSLGIVLYEMLTGTVPFCADSAISIAMKHLNEPLPPLPTELVTYQTLLDQLTAKDRTQRFNSSTDVKQALGVLCGLSAMEQFTSPPQSVTEKTRVHGQPVCTSTAQVRSLFFKRLRKGLRSWKWWLAVGCAVVLALVMVGVRVHQKDLSAAERMRAQQALEVANKTRAQIEALHLEADALIIRADRARKARDVNSALKLLSQARERWPDHPRLARLQADVIALQQKLQQRQQKIDQRALQYIAKADIYLKRQPVTLRTVAGANDYYEKAASLGSDTPGLKALRARIQVGYATVVAAQLNTNDSVHAVKTLNYARKRQMSGPQLEQLATRVQ